MHWMTSKHIHECCVVWCVSWFHDKIKLLYFIYIHLNRSDFITAKQLNWIWTHDKWTNPVTFSSFTFVCVCVLPQPQLPADHLSVIIIPLVITHCAPLSCMIHLYSALIRWWSTRETYWDKHWSYTHTHTTSSYFLLTWEYICHCVCVYAKTLWACTYPPLACKRRQPPDG